MHVCTLASGHAFPTASGASFESITETQEHVFDTPVTGVGEHGHRGPLLLHHRSRPGVPKCSSHPRAVTCNCCTHRSISYLLVPDLHDDRINERARLNLI